MELHIVKRKGHKEVFDERKIYASAYSSALNAHYDEQSAEAVGALMSEHIKEWISDRKEVTAHELGEQMKKALKELDEDVAYMYENHMDIC